MRRTIVAALLGSLVCVSCAPAGEEAAITEGRGSTAAAAVGVEPAPVVASTIAPAPTLYVPPTTTTVAPTAPSRPAGTTTTTVYRRPAPPGVTTHGYGDQGWEKSASSGSTTVRLHVYPADIYLDQALQVHAAVSFTGGYKATRLDFGDGTVVEGPDAWHGLGCSFPPQRFEDRWLINGSWHTYAKPGTYTVTATITVSDCQPPAYIPVAPPPTVPGAPPFPGLGPPPTSVPVGFGNDTSVTVSLPVLVWPEKVPPPVGPPPGP